jgi:UDP-N-acetyl-D-galactosamine dehydrogenase
MSESIAVIGLGYVGLPVALAMARAFENTIGFDIDALKISELERGFDRTGEIEAQALAQSTLTYSCNPNELASATFFVVAVPTPIDQYNRPDLTPLIKASEMIGRIMKLGAVVVYESTVYPGVTEDVCGPVLAGASGLAQGRDFKLGYSPERINPGDKEHTLERIIKVVSGEDAETLERVAQIYSAIVPAGIHKAPSIKVAEAAKVIENTQRDLNIALMNELALIFDRIGIRTRDVLAASSTKWNFLPFKPGLVGGHCIGVDPYYLTTMAEALGYHPQVILAGRRINDGMGAYVAQRLVKMLINADIPVRGARIAILGLTFKEDVPDLRNSRVPDIINELRQFGISPIVHDAVADAQAAVHEYAVELATDAELVNLDGMVLAVPHRHYLKQGPSLATAIRSGGVLIDVKSALDEGVVPSSITYWSL